MMVKGSHHGREFWLIEDANNPMMDIEEDNLDVLRNAIEKHSLFVDRWAKPVETLLFETIRAIDNLFMQEIFLSEDSPERLATPEYLISTYGVNQALARMIPEVMSDGPFRLFPSTALTQSKANEFVFQCGILERARILCGWLEDNLLTARLDPPSEMTNFGIKKILVLKTEKSIVILRSNRDQTS